MQTTMLLKSKLKIYFKKIVYIQNNCLFGLIFRNHVISQVIKNVLMLKIKLTLYLMIIKSYVPIILSKTYAVLF